MSVSALERYVTGPHLFKAGSYCFKVTPIPSGPASVSSLVARRGSTYAITMSSDKMALTFQRLLVVALSTGTLHPS